MADFRKGTIMVMIATDVVGRGIDVTGISHVVNYDLPEDIENYVHRVGRTGRMGKDGIAISFVTPEQGELLTEIEIVVNRLLEQNKFANFEAYRPRTRAEASEHPKRAAPVFGRQQKRYSRRL